MAPHEGLPQSPPPPEDAERARLQARVTEIETALEEKTREIRSRWQAIEDTPTMTPGDLGMSHEDTAAWQEATWEQQQLYRNLTEARRALEDYRVSTETRPPQVEHEHASRSEMPPAMAENPELEILLQAATDEQERNLMRQAYRHGVENISYAGNNPEESSAFWDGELMNTFVNTHGGEALTRLHGAFYAGGRWRITQEQTRRHEESTPPRQAESAPPTRTETPPPPAHETTPPPAESAIRETPRQTPELSRSAEEKERLVITLDELKNTLVSQLEGHATINNLELQEDAGRLQLRAELSAGLLGGEISIKGTIVNRDHEIAVEDLAIQARGYVKTRIENNLSRFFPTIKTHFENRYGKEISSIQIVNGGLEITFETSPNAAPEPPVEGNPVVAEGEAQHSTPEARATRENFAQIPDAEPDPESGAQAEPSSPEVGIAVEQFANLVEHARNAYPHLIPYLEQVYQSGRLTPAQEEAAEQFTEQEQHDITAAYWLGVEARGETPVNTQEHIRSNSHELIDSESIALQEARQRLDEARTEYARLLVVKEKQGKNRPRERQEAGTTGVSTRINLLREDIMPIEGLAEAEHAYRAALAAVRAHGGQILRENAAGLSPRKLQKEIKNQFREATLYEADRLYSEKIDAELAEKPRIRGIVGEVAQGYREMSTWWKMTASGTIFFGTAAEDILLLLKRDSPLLTSTEEPTELQNTIMGILVAKAGQSMTKGYQKTKARRETRRAMTREAKMQNGDLLAALLATDNERLNDLTLTQAARKSDEKTKRRVAAAVGAAVGYITSKFLLG